MDLRTNIMRLKHQSFTPTRTLEDSFSLTCSGVWHSYHLCKATGHAVGQLCGRLRDSKDSSSVQALSILLGNFGLSFADQFFKSGLVGATHTLQVGSMLVPFHSSASLSKYKYLRLHLFTLSKFGLGRKKSLHTSIFGRAEAPRYLDRRDTADY